MEIYNFVRYGSTNTGVIRINKRTRHDMQATLSIVDNNIKEYF